jgi:hypothetical protein
MMMKKLLCLAEIKLILLCLISLVFFSCSKNDSDDEGQLTTPKYESVSAKYNIASSSVYSSIEIGSSGNYIIVKKVSSSSAKVKRVGVAGLFNQEVATRATISNNNIIYGKYTINADGSINLEGFGKVVITTNKDKNVANINLTTSDGDNVILSAEKEDQLASDQMNDNLCRSWNIVTCEMKIYQNSNYIGTMTYVAASASWNITDGQRSETVSDKELIEEYPEYSYLIPNQVLLSKSGSYLVYYKAGTLGLARWSWKDKSAGTFYYNWSQTDNENDGFVTISFNGNKMNIYETTVSGTSKIEWIWTMQSAE